MIANMLVWKLYPLNPVPWVRPFVVMILKYFEEGNEVQANQQGYVVVKPHLQERCLIYGKTIPALERAI
jgi:hypothetical protein